MEFDTLEAAQAEIVRQQERIAELETERDTLSQNNKALTEDNDRIRTHNQSLFNKLMAQHTEPSGKTTEEEEPLTCEEFAKTIKF